MKNSQEYLKQNKITPRISFKNGEPHTVELIEDKMDTITDELGKEIEGMKYLVKEGGEHKSFFTSSLGLIAKLAQCETGDIVTIKMGRTKGEDGKYKSHYRVDKGSSEEDDNTIIDDGSF